MKKFGLLLGGLALATTPVMAENQRATAPVTAQSELEGEGILAALAFAAAIVALAVIASDDDEPISA